MSVHRVTTAAFKAVGRRPAALAAATTTSRRAAFSITAHTEIQNSTARALAGNKKSESANGSLARTDESITVKHPMEHEIPSSEPIAGAAQHPTLSKFSLQGKVGVVTGGARGLGLVMGQGIVVSGADLAIVDMNSTSPG